MKQPSFCGRELLPLSVIEAARAGDPLAVERVLRYYEGYIDKLCTRTLYDLDGSPHVRVDEYMKTRLQSKLIRAILNSHKKAPDAVACWPCARRFPMNLFYAFQSPFRQTFDNHSATPPTAAKKP